MKQNKLFIINNPVTLHFYSPEEQLPDDDSYKIVIYKTSLPDKKIDFAIACYDEFNGKKWETDHLYELTGVIAWATFSPEWVVSETDRDIFGCK